MPIIQCPACTTGSIDLNPQFLIMGAVSECTHCQARIGVAQEVKHFCQINLKNISNISKK